jgi:polysaccharide deacetylase 2 family uncharacterized protein YibQ
LRLADGAFWLVLFFSAMLGGQQLAEGFPRLLGSFFPPRLFAAEASAPAPQGAIDVQLPPPADLAMPELRLSDDLPETAQPPEKPASVAIVIDDLGPDAAHTKQAIALPREIALSFLPYSAGTREFARQAKRVGHEVLVHVPMEAIGGQKPGPMALEVGLAPAELRRRLDWSLSRVPGFTGINNHEGSRLTSSRESLIPIVEDLATRGVFFFDSRTSADSQVVPVARAFGVASAARDIFLDDIETIDGIDAQLRLLEKRARRQGTAIAIGHPRTITLDAVAYWAAHRDNIELISLGDAIRRKTEREARLSLSLPRG